MVDNNNDSVSSVNSIKGKHAAMEIYRPPSLRFDDNKGKLNVHAKEFIMSSNTVKSNADALKSEKIYPLASSKSSGSVLPSQSKFSNNEKLVCSLSNSSCSKVGDLQHIKSSGNILLENNNKVHFKVPSPDKIAQKLSAVKEKKKMNLKQTAANLKRSKSFNATDALMELEATLSSCTVSFNEYHLFPTKLQGLIKLAVENTNQMIDKDKIILGRAIVEHSLSDKKMAFPCARISVLIMDQDTSGAYLDSVMNTCQMLYQLKQMSALADSTKFMAFMAFLVEIFSQLKRSKTQLKLMSDCSISSKIIFLDLIARCCEDILLENEIHSLPEIECLFLALTSVGRDIQIELPNIFARLFDIVREVLLKSNSGLQVQKNLLQLIELRAANWQLPISALNYYYPKTNSI